jgi:hypothetical protein
MTSQCAREVANWEGKGERLTLAHAARTFRSGNLLLAGATRICNDSETERNVLAPILDNEERMPAGITADFTMYNTNGRWFVL